MPSPKLSYLPLLLITLFLLAHKITGQLRQITNTASFPHHMYRYKRYKYNNLNVSLQYQYEVASCFQIWFYLEGSNLAGQPYSKSDTKCGNFTISHSWNGIGFVQVKAIQLKEPYIDYRLYINQFSTPDNTLESQIVGYRMLQQFPNLPVTTVYPFSSSLYFSATEAYFQYKTYHSNQSMAYFVSEAGYGYCLKKNQLSQVYTKIEKGMSWDFVANFSVSNTSSIIYIYYNVTIYVDDKKINGSEPVYWNWRVQTCTSIRPPPLPRVEKTKSNSQYFLFVCKIGLAAIIVFLNLL